MKKQLLICTWLFSIVLLASCAETTKINESNNAQACDTGAVRLIADFETSRMDECVNLGNNNFIITIKPENTPINPSPWYAFKVVADQPTQVKVAIKIAGKRENRYLPKISSDMKSWHVHEHRYRGKVLTFNVNANQHAIYIAGQEVINNQYYVDWAKKLQQTSAVKQSVLGQSLQGRPIYKIESHSNSKEWLVILGRLHPPEITGALALFPFVETLLANNSFADSFRQKYNLLIIPNLNPDGVAMGNWRHNANGVDLNRDWITFKQPETQQVHQYLQGLVADGQKIKFAVDFHSTQHDVFYTMPVDYGVEDRYFVKHWLGALDKAMPNFEVVQKPGNRPNNGVSKQYFADNYNVHAITYEMGDETNRDNIDIIANNAAVLLMKTLMSATDHNKE
ncbi:M14 family metallopeptidase [Cognaticolwellia mytili]|uniref:M14 family metallopeptidase n=1 Tax=Cognaticolwellia mytili TaxID=1888913 RepID=UPI000A16E83D|nr:M14-type cytosolic carboxypeptidase [Cognaticolwellia mytili]